MFTALSPVDGHGRTGGPPGTVTDARVDDATGFGSGRVTCQASTEATPTMSTASTTTAGEASLTLPAINLPSA